MFVYYNDALKENEIYHYVEIIIDDNIKCLCGKKFKKEDVILTERKPDYFDKKFVFDCIDCESNLHRFWKENIKILSKVEGTSLYRIGDSDNMIHIKEK